MVIAVDAALINDSFSAYNRFLIACFKRLAHTHSNHNFIFIGNQPDEWVITKNETTEIIPFSLKSPLSKFWWKKVKLPTLLKKHEASVWISTNPANSKVPQCLIVNDFSFNQRSKNIKKTIQHLQKANSIIAPSLFLKNKMMEEYGIDAKKITVVYYAASPDCKPATWEEKEAVKNKYTNGIDYFLCPLSFSTQKNLITLLKAFSKFKKWQKSSMQLLIASTDNFNNEFFLKNLQTYKYRDDVKLVNNLPVKEMALITAASYAVVYVPVGDDLAASVMEAMQCGVPVITSADNVIQEIAAESALYASSDNIDAIATHLITLYKDENKRNQMIADGLQQAQLYDEGNVTEILWECVVKAMDNKANC